MSFPFEPQPDLQPQPLPTPPSRQPRSKRRRPLVHWRLWLPLLAQMALIVAVPAQDAYTYATGTPVTLQTLPVDPFDLLRGYYQTLRYTISDPSTLSGLPGGEWFDSATQGQIYVVLQAPSPVVADSDRPQPWQPIRVTIDRPTQLATNQVAIQGFYNGWQVVYGLETYYMPEDQRIAVNDAIRNAQGTNPQTFVVDAKVDGRGNAIPLGLWVGDRNYQF